MIDQDKVQFCTDIVQNLRSASLCRTTFTPHYRKNNFNSD